MAFQSSFSWITWNARHMPKNDEVPLAMSASHAVSSETRSAESDSSDIGIHPSSEGHIFPAHCGVDGVALRCPQTLAPSNLRLRNTAASCRPSFKVSGLILPFLGKSLGNAAVAARFPHFFERCPFHVWARVWTGWVSSVLMPRCPEVKLQFASSSTPSNRPKAGR